ncbi:MAG: dihydrodipicolinate synthase family protein [Haliscomenobacter sp.]|nr:dihydrodipicolinate synthase family protein [Haliscomenobacter sp.]MBK7477525.1 dihydrodipicolinate synthase family protein [Haliscomenobacter sp.]MBK8879016.1 dihydrodipicolinate synthase family protein [Haliscomenobacter sp.]
MTLPWTGVYPAITTKFAPDGALDIPAFLKNIQAQLDAGIDGLILGGSLGESSTISHDERMELLQATLDFVGGRIPVLVNIAEGSTRNAVALAERAQSNGAQGLMVLPPMMYKPTDRETTDFFIAVAQSTDLPILIYNNPVDYKIEVTLDMFEELLKFKNIQAVKESTRDLSNVTRIRRRFGNDLKVLCGVDTLALESLLMGADGWVAGLVAAFPRETVAIYRLAKAGRVEEAIAIHRWFLPILELDINPQLVQNIKLAEVMTGLGTEYVRPPRQPLMGAERERVIRILEEGLAIRPELPDYLRM